MTTDSAPLFHRQLQILARWLFAIYHDIQVEGAGHIPSQGPAIIAANHPTYLDPAFLMVGVKRPVRFMAWEKPFRLPLLGALMRSYGAIPVDMRQPGKESFAAAVKVLRAGEVFGIFPEGGRTRGLEPMDPFKSGVARLALMTGAQVVPATIIGGSRVWRRGEWFPKPGPILVRFHAPIRVSARALAHRDKDLENRLIAEIIQAIHRDLAPAIRKEERVDRLLEAAPRGPEPSVEGIPLAFFLLSRALLTHAAWLRYGRIAGMWLTGYAGLLMLSMVLDPKSRWGRGLRGMLPWLALAGIACQTWGAPRVWLAACEVGCGICILWLQMFRFHGYRRWRGWLLGAAYGAWLWAVAVGV